MAFPKHEIPDHVVFTDRAAKDLFKLYKLDRVRFLKVWDDLKRLGNRTLPQTPKKLKGFDIQIWQIDSGDFRIFMYQDGIKFIIRGVLAKPDQKKRFKAMR